VLAAIGMVSGGVVQVLAGVRVRAARTGAELVSWGRLARQAGLLIVASAFVSLMTGGHLAGAVWTTDERSGFSFPFITLGVLALVLLAPIGPMLGGARLRRVVAQAAPVEDRELPVELRTEASAPAIWGPIHSLLGGGIGFVALMTYKPGWVAGAVLLVATFAIGWAAGVVVARRPA
ncbi:MAG: hypothetical protein KY457_13610, partial [Actinobacteria bacterium]|nr:hypothetical protein [Actinomycetota bacterium]